MLRHISRKMLETSLFCNGNITFLGVGRFPELLPWSDGTQSAHVQNQGCSDVVSTAREASHSGFAGSFILLSEPVYCRLIVHNLTFGYVTPDVVETLV